MSTSLKLRCEDDADEDLGDGVPGEHKDESWTEGGGETERAAPIAASIVGGGVAASIADVERIAAIALGHLARLEVSPRSLRPRWAQGRERSKPTTSPGDRSVVSSLPTSIAGERCSDSAVAPKSAGRKSPRHGGGVDLGRGRGPRQPSRTLFPTATACGEDDRRAAITGPRTSAEPDDLQDTSSNVPDRDRKSVV